MRVRASLSTAFAFSWVAVCSAAPIITTGQGLTQSTWKDIETGTWLIEHYSPYCHHCKSFAPKWRDVVEQLGAEASKRDFHFAQVDCAANGDLCSKNSVKYYPSIFLYRAGKNEDEFKGARDVKSLRKYVESVWDLPVSPIVEATKGEDIKKDGVAVREGGAESPAAQRKVLNLNEMDSAETGEGPQKIDIDPLRPKLRLNDSPVSSTSKFPGPHSSVDAENNTPSRPNPVAAPPFLKQGYEDEREPEGKRSSLPSSGDGKVHALSAADIPALMDPKAGPAFVKFYAPWCSHCKTLAPAWAKLAEELKDQVSVYEMDCDTDPRNKQVCAVENVKAYPTLVFYNEGAKVVFKGTRSLAHMKEFALKAAASMTVRSVANEYELKRAVGIDDVVFLFLHPADASQDDLSLGREASKALIGGPSFYTSSSPDLFALFKLPPSPVILVFKEHSLTPSSSVAFPATLPKLQDWIRTAKLAFVTELSGSTFNDVMPSTGNAPFVALAFLSPKKLGNRFESSKKEVEELARGWTAKTKTGREVVWAWVDTDKWASWAKSLYGLKAKDDVPLMIVTDPKSMDFWSTGLDRVPLTIHNGAALYSLIEDGIYTGVARPQSAKNFVDRLGNTISNGSKSMTGGAAAHPILTFLLIILFVLALYTAARKIDIGGGGREEYAKLE